MPTAKIVNTSNDAELFLEYKETKDLAVREKIISKYMFLAEIITKKYLGRGVEYDDLFQVACLGLINAVDRYDVQKGVKFATFATPTILGEIKRYFRDKGFIIKIPRKIYQIFQKASRIRQAKLQSSGSSPTVAEISRELGICETDIVNSFACEEVFNIQSLEQAMYAGNHPPFSNIIGIEEDCFVVIENRDFLCSGLRALTKEEKELVFKRYYKNKTQKELAQEFGVSQMYISRLERKVIKKLRDLYFES